MRVSVAPIAMQCKVCEPLLIVARVERMRIVKWKGNGCGSGGAE